MEEFIEKFIKNPGDVLQKKEHRACLKNLINDLKKENMVDVGYCLGFVSAALNSLIELINSDDVSKDVYELMHEAYGEEFEKYCYKIGGFAKKGFEAYCR